MITYEGNGNKTVQDEGESFTIFDHGEMIHLVRNKPVRMGGKSYFLPIPRQIAREIGLCLYELGKESKEIFDGTKSMDRPVWALSPRGNSRGQSLTTRNQESQL